MIGILTLNILQYFDMTIQSFWLEWVNSGSREGTVSLGLAEGRPQKKEGESDRACGLDHACDQG